jgi:hypothetical protein
MSDLLFKDEDGDILEKIINLATSGERTGQTKETPKP